ncbi:MAG TPA: class I tRNA ligase family protein, partial [Candidatus Saccharimonadia bacterium]|nr:class I tRNA ligase family protein [Candidatus Saccharimonadia bacterium]
EASLADAAAKRYGMPESAAVTKGHRASGRDLEHVQLRHPFYDRTVPVIVGEHVTTDAGTGAVHTAPGHGQEDFAVGQQYGLDVLNPGGGNGVFLPGTELFAGQHIFKANDAIIEELDGRGVLLAREKLEHSYPHCWRHKTPVAFRTTPQWFIAMDQAGLRKHALAAIHKTRWIPGWGEERIAGMIENRPDWCISRQRTWGVPIALFARKSDGMPHPDSAKLLHEVADLIERDGVEAWYALDPASLIGGDAEHYDKVTDILDVWFDSGVTHAGVLDARAEFVREPHEPKRVMYLEGSDQHRGWFHSSLLTSTAMSGHAPYTEVLTHGFTVDAQGRKMSKSLGNVVSPQKVVSTLGADVLRLWVASTDYANEMSVSDEILKRVADSYRRIRNTARFLFGNLAGFDPSRDLVPVDQMLLLDRWALAQAVRVMQLARRVYGAEAGRDGESGPDSYRYQALVQELMRFCTVDMGAAYLDMTKDRLYTLRRDAPARRSAQSAMYWTLEILVRAMAPVLAFTSEELWAHMPARRHESVLFATWAELDALVPHASLAGERDEALFALLDATRTEVARVLETMRNDGAIGSSLDAEVELHLDDALHAQLAPYGDELRYYFITSSFVVRRAATAPADALPIAPLGHAMSLVARASAHAKCVRCWHHVADVGDDDGHPELCGRCVSNVAGPGEQRRWF